MVNNKFLIDISQDIYQTVHFLAQRDNVTEEVKVVEILEDFLETQEDEGWNKIAEDRETKDALAHAPAR